MMINVVDYFANTNHSSGSDKLIKYKYYNKHLDIMLILTNIYIVSTHIYSLHLVVNIIVFKRLTKINKFTKSVRINKVQL